MRHPAALAVLALALGTGGAAAEPSVVGGNLGVARGDDGPSDRSTSVGVWARKSLQPRLWAQLEVSRVDTSGRGTPSLMPPPGSPDILSGGGLLVVDLERRGSIVPVLLVGAGLDRAANVVRDATFVHAEVGVGLELRTGSLMLGIDARLGMRNLAAQTTRDILVTLEPRLLSEGSYRMARLVAGLSF